MYTGNVVKLRSLAFVLALLLTATPVLGVVCQMDCDQPPAKSSACHESAAARGEPTVRSAQHGCDHDQTTGSPALLASISARDSVAHFVANRLPTLAAVSAPDARVAILAMHGPRGVSGRNTSSTISVLRI